MLKSVYRVCLYTTDSTPIDKDVWFSTRWFGNESWPTN